MSTADEMYKPDPAKVRETEAYLARIRRTIAESSRLVEQANLRIAETDRMLESQGLTREQVMGFRFTPEQREAVNRELVRQGMEPLEEESFQYENVANTNANDQLELENGTGNIGNTGNILDTELAERQRKFGMMMKPFQI